MVYLSIWSERQHSSTVTMTTQVKCAFPHCSYIAEHESEQIAVLQFQSHLASHTQPSAAKSSKQKLPPIERPKLKQDITEEEWDTFTQEWKRFKRCTDIPVGQEADQLFDCCEKLLRRLILKVGGERFSKNHQHMCIAYFFDADSKNHIHFVQK